VLVFLLPVPLVVSTKKTLNMANYAAKDLVPEVRGYVILLKRFLFNHFSTGTASFLNRYRYAVTS
jgi:hypothetical protein